ncbi:hypothetical protein [Candidatus Magnetominusculus dajiuhuensis]|uniref:hypothetical protein n=1 Tax=Candidatus Magnetominusculus dajiuhuensis TaxID=3137712 RepID=UPI003B4375C3
MIRERVEKEWEPGVLFYKESKYTSEPVAGEPIGIKIGNMRLVRDLRNTKKFLSYESDVTSIWQSTWHDGGYYGVFVSNGVRNITEKGFNELLRSE